MESIPDIEGDLRSVPWSKHGVYSHTTLSICLSAYLPACLSIHLSVYLQAWERSYLARLPPFSKLTASKTKQFSETSLCFNLTTSKKRSNSARLLQNEKSSAELMVFYLWVLRFVHSICLKYCACHEKWSQVKRSAAPVMQNHLSKPEHLMLQSAATLRKSAGWPPNISHDNVSCTALATQNASLQILFKCPRPANVCETATRP